MEEFEERQLQTILELEEAFKSGRSNATVVPYMQKPEDDDRLCLTAVAFVPAPLRAEIVRNVIGPFSRVAPRQYHYPPACLHVTIQNLRSISKPPAFGDAEIATARKVFARVVPRHRRFSLKLRRILELPTSLALCAFSGEQLACLVADLRAALAAAGLPDDKQYAAGTVFANATVCRFSEPAGAELLALVQELKEINLGEMTVAEIHLISTNAVCHPSMTRIHETFSLA